MMHPNSVPDPKVFEHRGNKIFALVGGGLLFLLALLLMSVSGCAFVIGVVPVNAQEHRQMAPATDPGHTSQK